MRANKKTLGLLALASLVTFQSAIADTESESFWGKKKEYPKIYPFIPMGVNEIYKDVQRISEDKNFIRILTT